jgi:hypothetical protein
MPDGNGVLQNVLPFGKTEMLREAQHDGEICAFLIRHPELREGSHAGWH